MGRRKFRSTIFGKAGAKLSRNKIKIFFHCIARQALVPRTVLAASVEVAEGFASYLPWTPLFFFTIQQLFLSPTHSLITPHSVQGNIKAFTIHNP